MKKRAFTLIELLTVVAIITILFAIVIPVASTVRDSARAAKCTSNIRQSGLGLIDLADLNDGVLQVFRSGSEGSGGIAWARQLEDNGMGGARDAFFCPSQDHKLTDIYAHMGNPNSGSWAWRVYGMNMIDEVYGSALDGRTQNIPVNQWRINIEHVRDPSHYWLLADSIYLSPDGWRPRFRIDVRREARRGETSVHLRHNERANVFFLDGHIESAGPRRLAVLGFTAGHLKDPDQTITFPQPN